MQRVATGVLVAGLAWALLAANAAADPASLARGAGRPGPAILYERPARSPQLENTGPWQAPPILVSGATAYRAGEFLYQDFLYDDHGAKGTPDPGDPRGGGSLFSPPNGTYTYPTASAYAGNAADLVELRVRPAATETLLRLTLNTLVDPELVGATIAIGASAQPQAWPDGANVSAPAELFLTWHGQTATLRSAATGEVLAGRVGVSVDRERRQVELRVPHAAWAPGTSTVRLAAGVGLWDRANDRYLLRPPPRTRPRRAVRAACSGPRRSSTSPFARPSRSRRSTSARSPTRRGGATASKATAWRRTTSARSPPRWTSPASPGASPTTAASRRPGR